MDRSWIELSWNKEYHASKPYIDGVVGFLDFAFSKVLTGEKILCPCVKCNNQFLKTRREVFSHLVCEGILSNYTVWSLHGEVATSNTNTRIDDTGDDEDIEGDLFMHDILQDAFSMNAEAGFEPRSGSLPTRGGTSDGDTFRRLMQDAEKELYPGCKDFSKLSFIVQLYHIKCLCKWSNKSFSLLLDLLKKALPEGNALPNSEYETKKMIKNLGLSYKKYDACPNDCMLFWKEASKAESCFKCGASRYETTGRKVAVKTLRHFPLIPRLQRLYTSSVTSSVMRWHQDQRKDDGKLRHSADSISWKDFDEWHPSFSDDPRNVRLGLASDGFNPYSMMSSKHNTWPVIVVPYNLPPWMCMKQTSFMMTLLIPGPKQPGNDIDVFLQPLIDELKILWEIGVDTYDANKEATFRLRACLLWTINDFPAYANLSGWSTKGAFACPCCNKYTMSTWLKHSGKHCYQGHRRWLKGDHRFRREKRSFNGEQEFGGSPQPLSGNDVLEQLEDVQFPTFGKKSKNQTTGKRKRAEQSYELPFNWKKKSIFFDLPYWKDNLIRHNLDVMHIEKNVCDNIIWTLLDVKGKTKDSLKARLDLKHVNIRPNLHPQMIEGKNKMIIPPACYTLSKEDKDVICSVLKGGKGP